MKFLNRLPVIATVVLALGMLTGANGGGCGTGLDNQPGIPGLDVGGVQGAGWTVSYGATLHVVVKGAAGAVVAQNDLLVAQGGTFVVDGSNVDLRQLCARGDVACPQDVFPAQVTLTQPGANRHLLYVTFNPKGPLHGVVQTTLLGNVDSVNNFAIALGVSGATNGVCGLLGISYANGSLQEDPLDTSRADGMTGEIITAYSGGCVVAGQGAGGAGLSVEFHLPFTATRLR